MRSTQGRNSTISANTSRRCYDQTCSWQTSNLKIKVAPHSHARDKLEVHITWRLCCDWPKSSDICSDLWCPSDSSLLFLIFASSGLASSEGMSLDIAFNLEGSCLVHYVDLWNLSQIFQNLWALQQMCQNSVTKVYVAHELGRIHFDSKVTLHGVMWLTLSELGLPCVVTKRPRKLPIAKTW